MPLLPRVATVAVAAAIAASAVSACSTNPVERTVTASFTPPGPAGFTPTTVRVDKGDKVELTVRNTHTVPHGFNIDAVGVKNRTVEPGKPIEVKFTARRAGTFQIYCHLHPAHGKASLRVT